MKPLVNTSGPAFISLVFLSSVVHIMTIPLSLKSSLSLRTNSPISWVEFPSIKSSFISINSFSSIKFPFSKTAASPFNLRIIFF